MIINVYDFDKTIYDGDSTIDFYKFCIKQNKKIIIHIPRQIYYIILYKLKLKSKKKMKEIFFIFLKDLDNIDRLVEIFWEKNVHKIKGWYLLKEHNKDVIISASPEFLLKVPCDNLGVYKLIASKVDKKNGIFKTENCYGLEKVNRLKKEMKNFKIKEAYTDSYSDYPLLEIAEKGFIVKGNKISLYKRKR